MHFISGRFCWGSCFDRAAGTEGTSLPGFLVREGMGWDGVVCVCVSEYVCVSV